jgi:hypothetical protein
VGGWVFAIHLLSQFKVEFRANEFFHHVCTLPELLFARKRKVSE